LPEVAEFIQDLEKPTINKVVRLIDLLERFEHQLMMPHPRRIERNIFELRVRGKQEVRVMYTFQGIEIVLFYGFIKKSQQIPRNILTVIYEKLNKINS